MASVRDDPPNGAFDPNDQVHAIASAMDYQRGLSLLEQRFGPEHPKVALCLDGIAKLCRDLGNLKQAETLLRRALEILEKNAGPEALETAEIMENLTVLLYESGRDDEARSLYARAKAARDTQERRDRLGIDDEPR